MSSQSYSGTEKLDPAPAQYSQSYTTNQVGKLNRILSRLNGSILSYGVASGSGAPSLSVGSVGAFYIDIQNWVIYGPKSSNGWPSSGLNLSRSPVTVSSTYSIQPSDGLVLANAVSRGLLVYLPSSPSINQAVTIKKTDQSPNTVTVIGNIDGYTSTVISTPLSSIEVQYDPSSGAWVSI